MVVVAVEEGDTDLGIGERPRRVETAEAAAEDDHVDPIVHASRFSVLSSCSGSVQGSGFRVRGSGFRVQGSLFDAIVIVMPPVSSRERNVPLGGPASVVDTACPLDCPDACTLAVTVRHGKLVEIDGSRRNAVTDGYICAKVRKFGDRVYGPDRLLYPAVRRGRKGDGKFERVPWDAAMELIVGRMQDAKAQYGGASILPYSYGGSNGLLTQDNFDARLWRRFGTSRLARTLCAAPTGAANMALYGKMPSVTYQDYPEAALIVLWGVNPSASGIHLIPYVRQAQQRGAKLVVVDPRSTQMSRAADLHLPVKPGTDVAVAMAIHRHLFNAGLTDERFLQMHTRGAADLRARAEEWTFDRAADVAEVSASQIEQFAELYGRSSPALIRCGWGLERNRNGGNAALAVLALPAIGGKFGVRGGGYSMSNSASWNIERPWIGAGEPDTRVVNMNHLGGRCSTTRPSGEDAVRLQLQPGGNGPGPAPRRQGLRARGSVYGRVRAGDDRHRAVRRCRPPEHEFLEGYDFAKAYGP
jgi:anaerobic selenocysteine-containing dehydrogenase